ncbi:c-type cytochrome domain-containing protein [Ferribacterium limneticum]|uniref:c-type cytochrome domain-containing protein n=1 Tax=Ferribacterium limneticum TaxID=76259 RepID=UPI001CFB9BB7|nr:c-type cytochrome domain-containing protein [Ferribacterium limneticum]UCV17799.1 hypothetical protein KI610_13345 [Ferribacterium limneticum]
MKLKGFLGVFIFAGLSAYGHGQQTGGLVRGAKPAIQSVVSFKGDIQPILDAQCVACHQSGAASANLNLEDGMAYLASVRKGSQQSKLQLVTPGKPDESYLVRKLEGSHISAGGQGDQMPVLEPLGKGSITLIRQWIQDGAPDN